MTVGKMRKLMLKKVVPEKIIPQNIVDFLMDENAELAEPDAFTFLTRLRGLGIGSADFIYLLEGCGAPEAAVLKIKSNPAMNLQSLIVAMESSGMTSKDYVRILYTARQIWERTLTSRLDTMESDMLRENAAEDYSSRNAVEDPEDIEDIEEIDDNEENDENEDNEYYEDNEFRSAFEAVTSENSESADFGLDDTTGFSLGGTEEFESLLLGGASSDSDGEIADSDEVIDEYLDEQNTIIPASPEDLKKASKNFTVEIDYGDSVSEQTFETAEDRRISENFSEIIGENVEDNAPPAEPQPYNGDTTAIIRIDREMLEENLANIARNAGSPEIEEAESPEPSDRGSEDRAPVDDDYDEDYDYVRGRSRYYGGAIVAASIGAAVVFGAGVAAGMAFGMEPVKPIGYAEDEKEIFKQIYNAYNEKIAGGDSYYGYDLQDMTVFGDLLVERDGFGAYTQGSYVYTLTAEEITVSKIADGDLSFVGTFAPPEKTAFADAVQAEDGSLVAAFDGSVSGVVKISDGTPVYTVRQDGRLTDFSISGDEVRLGTVYTPKFYKSFKIDEREVYLPRLGKDYAAMPPQSVILSRTKGYSYGVSGAFSLENGDTIRADAVLGNPVFASGNGAFAVNSAETGTLLRVDYTNAAPATDETDAVRPKVFTAECGKFSAAAFCEKGSAVFENGSIVLRDTEFNTLSMLQSFSSIPERLRFSGDTLIVADKEKVFLTVKCADWLDPLPFAFRRAVGMVNGNTAVTLSQTAEGLSVTSWTLDETGAASPKYESVVALTGEQRGTLKFGGAETIVASENVCGAAYSYFDGVSVISEYVLLGDPSKRAMLYDDKEGFGVAFAADGSIYAECGKGLIEVKT